MLNNKIGIPYDQHEYKANDKKNNCNGFICLLNEKYNQLFKRYSDIKNFYTKLHDNFKIIDFENREKGDIIIFKKEGFPDHIAQLVSKTHIIHNSNSKFGSNIQSIDFLILQNYKTLIIREKK